MKNELFPGEHAPVPVLEGMWYLPEYADAAALLPAIESVIAAAPLRQMVTPGGFLMSVHMTNCGTLGWVSDRRGYRYSPIDPLSGAPWPPMPRCLRKLAEAASATAGYAGFVPDACLVNRYQPGAGMTAHQDRNEQSFDHPIVSLSLGLPARFFIQGAERRGRSKSIDLRSGDVVVWGGPSRLYYHGIRPLKAGVADRYGPYRFNLTFRRAGD